MIRTLITRAQLAGATVHTTNDGDAIATVQVIGLPGLTAWPLPVAQAINEIAAALGTEGA